MLRHLLLGATAMTLLPAALTAQTLPIPLGNSSIVPQVAPTPTPTPAPFPSPVVTPVAIPTPAPADATPAPRATPVPRRAVPSPRSTPAAMPSPTPSPTPAPSLTPTPTATPTPLPVPVPTATVTPAPIETVVLPQAQPAGAPLWPWLVGGAVLLGLGALLLRRRRPAEMVEWDQPEEVAAAEPEALPAAPALFTRTAPAAAARLQIDLRPTRTGINMLTATVETEVTVANIGTASVADVRAAVALTAATGREGETIEALAAQPIARPDTPPFALAPGEERRFRVVAALPLDLIPALSVGNRPIFVPLVVVTAQWQEAEAVRRTTRAFAVGVQRVDSAKLAPLWLDVPPRSYDAVAARAHGDAIER